MKKLKSIPPVIPLWMNGGVLFLKTPMGACLTGISTSELRKKQGQIGVDEAEEIA